MDAVFYDRADGLNAFEAAFPTFLRTLYGVPGATPYAPYIPDWSGATLHGILAKGPHTNHVEQRGIRRRSIKVVGCPGTRSVNSFVTVIVLARACETPVLSLR